jgi:hypothetical protein
MPGYNALQDFGHTFIANNISLSGRSKMPRIIFISNSVYPNPDTGGGNIVTYRHLKRFQNEGYEVVLIHAIINQPEHHPFEEIYLERKSWYPPLRTKYPFLLRLRAKLYEYVLAKRFEIRSGDLIIAMLGDYLNILALNLSIKYKLPLHLIYHDDYLFNVYANRNLLSQKMVHQLLHKATAIYAVSRQMAAILTEQGAKNVVLLYPIPEEKTLMNIEPDLKSINVAYSGLVFEDLHKDLLEWLTNQFYRANANLTLISALDEHFTTKLSKMQGLNLLPYFATNRGLRQFIEKNINVLLVFYAFNGLEHRMYTSFSSKFLEYCNYGLPVLIVAPRESTLGNWAIKNNWKIYLENLDQDKIQSLLDKLTKIEFWKECSAQSIQMSKTQFNADLIHQIFKTELEKGNRNLS